MGGGLRDRRVRLLFYGGAFLPDIVEKSLMHLTCSPGYMAIPSHNCVGLVLYAYILSLLFEEDFRRRAFAAIVTGSYLHILVDLFKDSVGKGSEYILFPCWNDPIEFGFYAPEDVIYAIPFDLIVIAALEFFYRRRGRGLALQQ